MDTQIPCCCHLPLYFKPILDEHIQHHFLNLLINESQKIRIAIAIEASHILLILRHFSTIREFTV